MRKLFKFFKMGDAIFFKDEFSGRFRGNILESVAQFFPDPYSTRILNEPVLNARWKVYERITWEGNHGYRFYTKPNVCEHLFIILSQVYEEHHKDEHYPNHFDGRADGLPCVCYSAVTDKGCFVIWDANKVQIEPKG